MRLNASFLLAELCPPKHGQAKLNRCWIKCIHIPLQFEDAGCSFLASLFHHEEGKVFKYPVVTILICCGKLIRWQIRWHLIFAVTLWTLRNSSDFQDFNRTRWKVILKMRIIIHYIAGLIIRINLICLNSIFYFYFISPDETIVSLRWNFCSIP